MIIPNPERQLLPKNIKNHIIIPIGTRFGKLQIDSEPYIWAIKSYRPICYTCLCNCGKRTDVQAMYLRRGSTTSCGCAQAAQRAKNGRATIAKAQAKNTKHGYLKGGRHPVYRVWQGIKERCLKPKHKSYPDYGGRGIKICDRWMDFVNFIADMGDRPSSNHSIERRDNDGNYEPNNCYWATKAEQARNSRNNRIIEYNGRSQLMVEWARELGIHPRTLITRFYRGWSVERALTTETNAHRPNSK